MPGSNIREVSGKVVARETPALQSAALRIGGVITGQ